jgi:hypothetical protein
MDLAVLGDLRISTSGDGRPTVSERIFAVGLLR